MTEFWQCQKCREFYTKNMFPFMAIFSNPPIRGEVCSRCLDAAEKTELDMQDKRDLQLLNNLLITMLFRLYENVEEPPEIDV